ncbi:prohead protease/major capsid protein fusion protein [Xenophilus sp.]|uniref:prohead protease/major capsid protein fusion protein n=1 Tax=Xenophilus sp. TaxID=1873499 RepID=UPI0037DCC629
MSAPAADVRREDLPLAGRTMELRDFQRAGDADAGADAPLATARLVFSAGAAVRRYDWFRDRPYLEQLVVEEGAVRMERLTRGAPLLNTHNSWDLEAQLGVVERPTIEAGQGLCDVTFSRRESIAGYVQDVADGIIRNVSVGYVRHRVEMVAPAEEDGVWTYRVIDWEPYEVSLVPIPADMDCQVRGEGASHQPPDQARAVRTFPCEFIEAGSAGSLFSLSERSIVPQTSLPEGRSAQHQQSGVIPQSSATSVHTSAQGGESEQARILELGRRHGMESFARGLVAGNFTLEAARGAIINELAREDHAAGGHVNVRQSQDGGRSERDLIVNTLAVRMGARQGDRPVIRALDCVGLAARALALAGVHVDAGWSRAQIIERAMAGLHTTGDFPLLLGNAVGRVLHESYTAAPAAIKSVARQVNATDFRARSIIRLGGAPTLEKVNEHGEFKYGSVKEASASWKLATYGRIFGLTRQALVNDDLGGFADLVRKFGEAASMREAEELVSILLSPPAIDGGPLFSADRKTLIIDDLDADGLGKAVLALRQQKDIDGTLKAQAPGTLIVPAALEMKALQLVATINATQTGDVQPYRLSVQVEPRLDAASAVAWYLVAANQSALEYGYLEGDEGPQITQREGFEVDGLEIKARLDFGCGWAAPLGWVKSNGDNVAL